MSSRRSSGSGASCKRVDASASAVTTPQPPTVVTTATRLPRGNGWVANVAAASKADSMVGIRITPAWRAAPLKMRSLLASDPVWDAAARWPALDAPPFTITTGIDELTSRSVSNIALPLPTPST